MKFKNVLLLLLHFQLKKVLKRRDESSNAIIGPVQKKLGGLADLQTIVEVLQDILDKRGRT